MLLAIYKLTRIVFAVYHPQLVALPRAALALGTEAGTGLMGSLFFPVLGVILSNALYFSSMPVIIQASRRGTLGSLNPLPLALMAVSTVSWMRGALSKQCRRQPLKT